VEIVSASSSVAGDSGTVVGIIEAGTGMATERRMTSPAVVEEVEAAVTLASLQRGSSCATASVSPRSHPEGEVLFRMSGLLTFPYVAVDESKIPPLPNQLCYVQWFAVEYLFATDLFFSVKGASRVHIKDFVHEMMSQPEVKGEYKKYSALLHKWVSEHPGKLVVRRFRLLHYTLVYKFCLKYETLMHYKGYCDQLEKVGVKSGYKQWSSACVGKAFALKALS
jgi:hypothetical protein